LELLSVENVTFRYPKASTDALRNVSLSVSEGQWAVLCGLSGCGKSTLLRLIKREIAPFGEASGRICLGNAAVRGADDLRKLSDRESAERIGIVLQDPESQIVTDTVWHELAFGLENLGLPSDRIRRRVAEMAAFFGMEDWYRRKTYELSGGQKQLLNLASALVMNPRLLLLDEPTAQLDPIAAADFRNVLRRIRSELGVTILMAEHRLEDVLPDADRIFLMDEGRILAGGDPAALTAFFTNNSHPMAQALPAATRVFLALSGGSVFLGGTDSAGDSARISTAAGPSAAFGSTVPLTVSDGRTLLRALAKHGAASASAGATSAEATATEKESASAEGLAAGGLAPQPAATPAGKSAATPAGKPALEVSGVRFRYDRLLPDVLCGASLTLHAGEHYCLLGGNGSGKTTLLALAAGILKPYAGSVRLSGRKLSSFVPGSLYRGNLALLPQQPRDVFTEKSIREDLLAAFRRTASDKTSAEADMLALCKRLRITGILDSHPYDVSGGELQKAALAKVLASRPKVLLLDEPTKGIDVRGKDELADILDNLLAEDTAVLSVTHDAEWAAAHADRCGLLFDGEVISEDRPGGFFDGNAFYTTAANRMARGILPGVLTVRDIVAALAEVAP